MAEFLGRLSRELETVDSAILFSSGFTFNFGPRYR